MLDTGYRILDAGFSRRASTMNDPDAVAAALQDRELDESIADPLSSALPKSPGKAFLFSACGSGNCILDSLYCASWTG